MGNQHRESDGDGPGEAENGEIAEPISNGSDGRNEKGQFTKGHPGGPGGSMLAARASQFRDEMLNAVSRDDMRIIIEKTVSEAKKGRQWAVHEIFDRLLGKPAVSVSVDAELKSFGVLLVSEEIVRTDD